jgi:TIR domain
MEVNRDAGEKHRAYRYQVGIVGADEAQLLALRTTIYRRLVDVGLVQEDVLILEDREVLGREKRAPFVGVYFGKVGYDPAHTALIDDLRLDSVLIVPVVRSLIGFADQVPPSLAPVNGLELDDIDVAFERVCAVVFQQFRFLRKERRLFISYRRDDSAPIASQLYAALDTRGFDVFLDTNGVPPGEDFQDVLWHRLADSDVVVLLDTDGFSESRWTQEEIAKANTTNIQILHLLWPGRSERADSAFSSFRRMATEDFVEKNAGKNGLLVKESVLSITVDVEALRARAIAARYRFLVDSFCDAARAVGLRPSVQTNRKIIVEGGKHRIVAAPLVGVPNSEGLHYEVVEFPESNLTSETRLWAIFDERGLLPRALEHLAWLSPKLPISAVPVFDVVSRLSEEVQ